MAGWLKIKKFHNVRNIGLVKIESGQRSHAVQFLKDQYYKISNEACTIWVRRYI